MIQQEVIEYTYKSAGNKNLAEFLKELTKKHKKIITVTPTMYADFSKPTDRGTSGGSYCSRAVIVVEVNTVDQLATAVLEKKKRKGFLSWMSPW